MKCKIPVILFSFLLNGLAGIAQKTVSEGTFMYDISIQNATDKNAPVTSASLTVFLKGMLSRTDMTSSLGSEKTIHDAKAGTAVILKEYSGQKLMITLNRDNWNEKNKKAEGVTFTDQAEKKEILNYPCTKATGKLSDGSSVTVFYTKDIIVQNNEYAPLFRNLGGTPLQYEVETGKLKFTYTINKIDLTTIPASKFELPKTGYRVITYEENKQSVKKLQ